VFALLLLPRSHRTLVLAPPKRVSG